MKKIGILYDYLFYTIYRFWEKAPSRWWSDWKTTITMVVLINLVVSIILNIVVSQLHLKLSQEANIFPIVVFAVFNCGLHYYLFLYKNKWKEKILKFQNIDRKKDIFGVIAVIFFVLLIAGSLIYSWHLLSIVDWDKVKPLP